MMNADQIASKVFRLIFNFYETTYWNIIYDIFEIMQFAIFGETFEIN